MNTITTSTDVVRPPAHSSDIARLTSAVESTLAQHRIPGLSLAVTSPDRLLFAGGFGHADLVSGAPATASTKYLWFSLTKIATATTTMRLVDTGKLELSQPVADFVPGYRTGRHASPTVRHLLNHTAGVANPIPIRWVRPADQPAPEPREFLDALLARYGKPKYHIGGPASYSNLGYLMLAEIVAQASGQPFIDAMSDAVLGPLKMDNTGFDYPHATDVAVGYVRAPRIATPLLRRLLPHGIVGARVGRYTALRPFLVNGAGYGGLVGDVTEAARLAAMHLADGTFDGERILAPATAQMMRTITAPGKPFDLGLGWFRKPAARGTVAVEHLGAGGGFFNAMRIYPDLHIGIVAMSNTTTAWDHASLFDTIAHLDWQDVGRQRSWPGTACPDQLASRWTAACDGLSGSAM
jgi:CubicO group peptidase (beta-lactamase class C family)